jgi:hypothetical protein
VGETCVWRDYKAIATDSGVVANLHQNQPLIDWVNHQPLGTPLTCLGDGHDGVWNIIAAIATTEQRREILDWYHLNENLHKVGGSLKPLHQAEAYLTRWATRKLLCHKLLELQWVGAVTIKPSTDGVS